MCLFICCHGYCPFSCCSSQSLHGGHHCQRSWTQTDGALRWDERCSRDPPRVGKNLGDPVSKRTIQVSALCMCTCSIPHMCAPVCHSPSLSLVTSLSLAHHKMEPRCKRVSCNQSDRRADCCRLTDGQKVRRASAKTQATGR